MAVRNETAKATIYLDGKQAEAALQGLEEHAKKLREALKAAQKAGNEVEMKKLQGELSKTESAQRSLRKETFDYERVLKNLNGASLNDLKKALRTVEIQMGKMSRTDPGYLRMEKQARLLRTEINGVTNSMRAQQSFFGRAADGVNKYFTVVTAAIASLAGISLTVKQTIKAYAEFDDKLADVMKTTGLTKDQVTGLNSELEKIDTRTSQLELLDLARVAGKLGITAETDILGFVRAADQIRVALTEDLGGNVEQSINEIGKLTDIFKLAPSYGIEQSMLKVGSAINALGAAGTANEGYLVEFAKRVGGIAPAAGITIQSVLGLGTTLDELGQTAEVSGTVYTQFISGMFKKTAIYADLAKMSISDFTELMNTDANEAFIRVLEGARGSGKGFGELAAALDSLGFDGARAIPVLSNLAGNTEKLREKQALSNAEFAKGTSITQEFNTKNTTVQAELEKARKGFQRMAVELGKQLMPAYASVISKSKLMIEALMTIISFITKYGRVIITLIVSIAAYTAATKLATFWQTRLHYAGLLDIATKKLTVFWTTAQKGATLLLAAAQLFLTGNIHRAIAAMRLFNMVTKLNPVGLLIGAVTGLATALALLSKRMNTAQLVQKTLNDVSVDASKNIAEEKIEIDLLLRTAKNELISKESRLEAIKELNKISPEYLGKLNLENIRTQEAKRSTDEYIKSLLLKAKVQAASQELVDIERELIHLERGEGAEPTFWQSAWNAVKSRGGALKANVLQAETLTNNITTKTAQLQTIQQNLLKLIDDTNSKINKQQAYVAPGGRPQAPGGEPDKTDAEKKKDLEKTLKALDEAHNERLLLIEQQQIKEAGSDAAFKIKMALAERAYLEQKKAILEAAGESSVEIDRKLLEGLIENIRKSEETLKELREQYAGDFIDFINDQYEKDNNALGVSIDKNIEQGKEAIDEMEANKKRELQQIEERKRGYMDLASSIGDSFSDLLLGQEANFGAFLKNTLVMALDALEKILIMQIAESTIRGLATGNIVGAFVKIIAIKAAFAVAKSAIMGFGGKKENKGYAEGGYTGQGDKYETAGVVHRGEWVAPREMVSSPRISPVIHYLETQRLAGNFNRVNVPRALPVAAGYAEGGHVTSPFASAAQGNQTDPGMTEALRKNTAAIEKLMTWKPTVYSELIKKDLDTLENINRNRGM